MRKWEKVAPMSVYVPREHLSKIKKVIKFENDSFSKFVVRLLLKEIRKEEYRRLLEAEDQT